MAGGDITVVEIIFNYRSKKKNYWYITSCHFWLAYLAEQQHQFLILSSTPLQEYSSSTKLLSFTIQSILTEEQCDRLYRQYKLLSLHKPMSQQTRFIWKSLFFFSILPVNRTALTIVLLYKYYESPLINSIEEISKRRHYLINWSLRKNYFILSLVTQISYLFNFNKSLSVVLL